MIEKRLREKNRTKVNQSQKINHRLKNKESESPHQKGTNPTEKGAVMKNQQAVVGDMTVIAEALAIETNTVGTTTLTMKEEIGINIDEDMNITLVEEHTHRNTGEEITMMTTNQDQDHQPTLDIKSIRKTA